MGNFDAIQLYNFDVYTEEKQRRTAGERIRSLRLKNNDTVIKLAQLLGINRKTLESYERGDVFPPVHTVINICNTYDCEIEYLLGFQEEEKRASTDVQRELGFSKAAFEKLSVDMREPAWLRRFYPFTSKIIESDHWDQINDEIVALLSMSHDNAVLKKRGIYRLVKTAYREAVKSTAPFPRDTLVNSVTQMHFKSSLEKRIDNDKSLETWLVENGITNKDGEPMFEFLFSIMEAEEAQPYRIINISDSFKRIVEAIIEEENNNAKKER